MSDQIFYENQDLILEVETEDSTLLTHSAKFIYYIPPDADGARQTIAEVETTAGTAVAGTDGNSVMQGAAITLIPGVYVFWAESDNASGKHQVSEAFEVAVWKRGTVRR